MDKLTQLQIFVRVAERAGFSAVARELNIPQSQVSRAVTGLEQTLKVRLLHRNTRRVTLTEAGQSYYQRCRQVLEDLAEADAAVSGETRQLQGALHVTAPIPFGLAFISPTLIQFQQAHPGIQVQLSLCDQYLDLIEHNIDVAIRLGSLSSPGTIVRRLGSSPFVLVASPGYLVRKGLPETLEALADHDCLVYTLTSSPQAWHGRDARGEIAVAVNTSYLSNSLLVLRDAAVAGLGVARLPLWMVADALQQGSLTQLLPGIELPSFDISAVYPSARQIPHKVRIFVDAVLQILSQCPHFDRVRPAVPSA